MRVNSRLAPHLPVHLGSMSTCVRTQAEIWKGKLKHGDVVVSNHPEFGGTHLPDITVITPAFSGDEIIFYVASRAHHADIGGILPGSMPPHSRELFQEGAAIKSEKLVSMGKFNEKRITELLYDEPAQYPECSGTRCLADNINDLKAQIAANQKGINLISTLIEDYGEEVVQFYMRNIQDNAELSVKNLLKDVSRRFEGQDLHAIDYMDDGSPIELKITIDAEKGEAVFDFDGTGPEVYGKFALFQRKRSRILTEKSGNTNAPEAVTYSAIIYCLRCLISEDIPLNQGCLKPIDVRIPKDSFLSPSDKAAVVGGNVLTVSSPIYHPRTTRFLYIPKKSPTNKFPRTVATRNRRNPSILLRLRRLPRRLQQSHFRLRRQPFFLHQRYKRLRLL